MTKTSTIAILLAFAALIVLLAWDRFNIPDPLEVAVPDQTRSVEIFAYDARKDTENGVVMCSSRGLVAIKRQIPHTEAPLREAIALLLRDPLTESEKLQGVTTEFPLPGFALEGAHIQDGVATLTFADPQNSASGGSCRISVLRAQIEATAKQFPGVQNVRILPEDILQP